MSDKIKRQPRNRNSAPPKNREEARAYDPQTALASQRPLRETNRAGIAG